MQRITLSTALLAAGLCGNPLPVVGAASGTHPNLVFILADDLGYGDLGSFGQQYIKTPNLDPLCADGMRLTNHYTGSTVCAPSRFTFVTGKHIGRAKTIGQGQQLAPNTQTIGTVCNPQVIARLVSASGDWVMVRVCPTSRDSITGSALSVRHAPTGTITQYLCGDQIL